MQCSNNCNLSEPIDYIGNQQFTELLLCNPAIESSEGLLNNIRVKLNKILNPIVYMISYLENI